MKILQINEETNSRIYSLAMRRVKQHCSWCGPNKGCNSMFKHKDDRNWKKYRRSQWK